MHKNSPKYLITLAIILAVNAHAATFFVNKSASGSNNGASWSNAWTDLSKISWSSLKPGDTVCVAGGNYSTSLSTSASGASGNPITVKRAVASDSTCGSSTSGWSASYDSQVIMQQTIGIGSNYVTIDGMVPNGISVIMQNPGSEYDGITTNTPTAGITLRYIEVAGPNASGTTNPVTQNGDHRSLRVEYWTGSDWAVHNNWLVQHVNFHGACNNLVLYGNTNMVIEHSRFADSATNGTAACHPNVVNSGSNSNTTFRYNEVTNWQVEGIMLLSGSGSWNVYGNIWHDPMTGSYPRVVETQESAEGPVLLYNDTFVNLYFECAGVSNGGSWASGTQGRNNIYWRSNGPCGLPSEDYDLSSESLGESHGEGNAATPFVSTSDFHLSAHTNPGLNLGSPYNIDYADNTRATWDRGAYEFGGSSSRPAPPSGLAAVVQ
jgi:hypothetical protein